MSGYLSKLAFELEQYLIQPEDIKEGEVLPDEIAKYIKLYNECNGSFMYKEDSYGNVIVDDNGEPVWTDYIKEYGGPTGIAKHPVHGWALMGAGQGPFIMWLEKDLP